jgi:nucleoside phosphorylase
LALFSTNSTRKHVSDELWPYTCHLRNCENVQPLFGTFQAWKIHISSGHGSLPKWECILCNPVIVFIDKTSFTEHAKLQHYDELDGENINDFIETFEMLEGPSLEQCPICSIRAYVWSKRKLEEQDFDPLNATFIEHIGTCMHDFSLLALPARLDEDAPKERSSALGGVSNPDSRSSLNSLDFPHRDTDRPGFSKVTKAYVESLEPMPLSKHKVEDWQAAIVAVGLLDVPVVDKSLATDETTTPRRLHPEDYTVGWVCALPVELAAAQEMLDEEHDTPPSDAHDTNIYTCGRVGEHNVVIACLPEGQTGTHSAAAVTMQMKLAFTSTRFGLMVGIGGGVPSEEADIRLGDVVISKPHNAHGGVVQYDSGKATPSGFERTGSLNTPPTVLLNAVANLRAKHMGGRGRLAKYLSKLNRLPDFTREAAGPDALFNAAYDHKKGAATCKECDFSYVADREPRRQEFVVHYGTIASGNQVMRNAAERDRVSAELGGVLCFEMEAAGLMNSFPCLVIRGICDYADSHKNKRWQAYAAGTAAACAKEVLSVIPSAEVAYYIPFAKNKYFIGRQNDLHVLQQKLMVDQDCQSMSIVGPGGTGKTQVALQFVYSVKEMQPEYSIFWVPALSMESFEQAYTGIARALRIPYAAGGEENVKELVQQHLSTSRAGRWLLVVDNTDDAAIFFGTGQLRGIVDYLPKSELGVVVYTTRTQEVAEQTRGDVIELGAMDRQDAAAFLTRSLTRKNLLCNDATTTELLDELSCLPLAIAQAAAYLNKNGMSVAKYMQLLRSTEQDMVALMSREFRDNTRYKGTANAVATTWVVSFSQIRERDAAAADLLAVMSCIEWKAIPRSLLPMAQGGLQIEEAIGTLCGYSFLARRDDSETEGEGEEEEWYDMHRLVHLATRIWVQKRGGAAGVQEKAVRHVAGVFPSDDHANLAVWRAYLPHALHLLECGGGTTKERSELCLLVGRCLRVDGRIREAVRWLEESCLRREALDEDDPDRLLSQHVLAMAYQVGGQVKKAVELLEAVVKARETLAADHPDRLASQHELAIAYRADGQVKKAVELLEAVVKAQETLVADHPSRFSSQHALAGAYRGDG